MYEEKCSIGDKPAWLDRILQATATTNDENILARQYFEGDFRITLIN